MNKKFLYKLLLIFALLAFTLLISNNKSFAATNVSHDIYNNSYIENSNNVIEAFHEIIDNNPDYFNFTSSDLPAYQVVLPINSSDGSTIYSLYCFEYPLFIDTSKTTDTYTAFKYVFDVTTEYYESYQLITNTTGFIVNYAEPYKLDVNYGTEINLNFEIAPSFLASNYDILDENGEVVFQQPPQVQETTLAPIVEGVETKKTLAEVVGILPIILVVVVGLLAMRKAIRFLMRTLKQG